MDRIDRNRVIVWPLDAWARRTEMFEGETLFWTNLACCGWRIPTGYDHIAWVDQGGDRGPLLKNHTTGIYMILLPSGAVRSVHDRKVRAALETLIAG